MAEERERETPANQSPWKRACRTLRGWGSDLQRYVGSLRLDLIRGLIGRKIREQEDLIGVTTECVCVCESFLWLLRHFPL